MAGRPPKKVTHQRRREFLTLIERGENPVEAAKAVELTDGAAFRALVEEIQKRPGTIVAAIIGFPVDAKDAA